MSGLVVGQLKGGGPLGTLQAAFDAADKVLINYCYFPCDTWRHSVISVCELIYHYACSGRGVRVA